MKHKTLFLLICFYLHGCKPANDDAEQQYQVNTLTQEIKMKLASIPPAQQAPIQAELEVAKQETDLSQRLKKLQGIKNEVNKVQAKLKNDERKGDKKPLNKDEKPLNEEGNKHNKDDVPQKDSEQKTTNNHSALNLNEEAKLDFVLSMKLAAALGWFLQQYRVLHRKSIKVELPQTVGDLRDAFEGAQYIVQKCGAGGSPALPNPSQLELIKESFEHLVSKEVQVELNKLSIYFGIYGKLVDLINAKDFYKDNLREKGWVK